MKNVGTTPERPTARSLLGTAIQRDATPPEIALSADRAFAELLVSLSRWVGDESARVLLERAVEETRVRHPWLAGVGVTLEGGRCLEGLDTRVAGLDVPGLTQALEDLLASLIDLLARFIGTDLAVRIVVRGWPGCPANAQRGGAP